MIHAKRTETAHMEHNVFLNIVCNFLFYEGNFLSDV